MMEIPITCYYLTRVIPITSDDHWIDLKGKILIRSGGPGYSLVSTASSYGLIRIPPKALKQAGLSLRTVSHVATSTLVHSTGGQGSTDFAPTSTDSEVLAGHTHTGTNTENNKRKAW